MLKLNASYSKKVPADTEYSSQSYHAQIEVELPDGLTQQQLQEKVHGVFDFVRNSVEAELHNSTQPQQVQQPLQQPQQVQELPRAYQQNQYQQKPRTYGNSQRNGIASSKQIGYLLSLAQRSGVSIQELLQQNNLQTIEQMPSKTCSHLIQQLSGQAA